MMWIFSALSIGILIQLSACLLMMQHTSSIIRETVILDIPWESPKMLEKNLHVPVKRKISAPPRPEMNYTLTALFLFVGLSKSPLT